MDSNNSHGSLNDADSRPEGTTSLVRTLIRMLVSRWRGPLVAFAILALPLAVVFGEPSPRPPRPTMTGPIRQGSAPCSNLPSDLATLRVTLIQENGSGVCDSGDTEILANVAPDGSGNYAIPAATGEPGWQGNGSYCIGVIRASLATPAPMGAIEPGTDHTTSYAVDGICVP